ncbi:MAG: ornithine carbamoyltransferase [Chloroflexi bacterium]|nr:ornithine carbamoyltransferase [Chloroflexota bacterium]
MKRGDLLSLDDLTPEQLSQILDRARELKARRLAREFLAGQSLALLFDKPSLRTRASFDVAMYELGGHVVYLGPDEVGLGRREAIADVARVLSQYVHAIAARIGSHQTLEELARAASVPVINALSDRSHPCQGLADLLTLREHFGRLAGIRLGYIGDGNNIAHTLLSAAGKVGLHLTLASPPGYECDAAAVERARREAEMHGGSITLTNDPAEAARDADALYTDVWTSMGQEDQAAVRRQIFARYRVDRELLRFARPGALVMHDLPAHRGEEITDEVIDGPQSVVFEQAANRLHVQKAVLLWLMVRVDGYVV